MRKILVTGGADYIGSHCCKLLRQSGCEPVVIDNLIYGHEEFVRWGEFVRGDVGNSTLLDELFNRHEFSAVIHFAAFAYVGESVVDPAKYYRNNFCNSVTLLEAMRRHGVGTIVFSSSCATYGNPVQLRMTESHPQNPINPYGRSKLMVEQVLADYHRAYGLNYVSLRYFNAAGADPAGEIGEQHEPETHLIPLVLDAAAGRRPQVEVYGNDYPTADGTCIRDYIHVTDLADAHARALVYLTTMASVEPSTSAPAWGIRSWM
jgi:UDP-glucose-4-epimerase GalE